VETSLKFTFVLSARNESADSRMMFFGAATAQRHRFAVEHGFPCAISAKNSIEHYRRIRLSIGDQITVERLEALIGDLQAQKAALHPEQKQ
jgi:hypothetical protein